jgi:hypothetical protein
MSKRLIEIWEKSNNKMMNTKMKRNNSN